MQTPDEIKKGLESCSSDECNGDHVGCPYITSTMCIMDMANDALAYINRLEQRIASVGKTCPEWISVDDRLPEYFKAVLIYCPTDKNVYEVYLETHGLWRFFDYSAGKIIDEPVTHWMPIPEPPKED